MILRVLSINEQNMLVYSHSIRKPGIRITWFNPNEQWWWTCYGAGIPLVAKGSLIRATKKLPLPIHGTNHKTVARRISNSEFTKYSYCKADGSEYVQEDKISKQWSTQDQLYYPNGYKVNFNSMFHRNMEMSFLYKIVMWYIHTLFCEHTLF